MHVTNVYVHVTHELTKDNILYAIELSSHMLFLFKGLFACTFLGTSVKVITRMNMNICMYKSRQIQLAMAKDRVLYSNIIKFASYIKDWVL